MPDREYIARGEVEKKLEEVRKLLDEKTAKFFEELGALKEMSKTREITQEELNKRLHRLEEEFLRMKIDLENMTEKLENTEKQVTDFNMKLSSFIPNMWKAIFLLIALVGSLLGFELF
jgi:chromosome segregation ATPase